MGEETEGKRHIEKIERKRQRGEMGAETEVRDRGEIHRRRDGGKETEGTDLWEGHRGTCRRGEREKKDGERKGKKRGRVKGGKR